MICLLSILNIIYGTGQNNYSQLGTDAQLKFTQFTQIDITHNFTQLFSGSTHTLAISDQNELYGWGNNNLNQVSELNQKIVKSPKLYDYFSNKTLKASAGLSHTVVLTIDNLLYSFGSNQDCQLGRYIENNSDPHPNLVNLTILQSNEHVIDVQCSLLATFILTNLNNVYFFGSCKYDLCPGFSEQQNGQTRKFLFPQKLDVTEKVKQLFVSQYRVFYLDLKHQLFGFGNNKYGALCIGTDAVSTNVPQKILIQGILKVTASQYHSVFQTQTSIYGCGMASHGQFGNISSSTENIVPISFNLQEKVQNIGTTEFGTYLLIKGQLYSSGRSTNGELGYVGDIKVFNPVQFMNKISKFESNINYAIVYQQVEEEEEEETQKPDNTILIVVCVVIAVIMISVIILLIVLYKLNVIKCKCKEKYYKLEEPLVEQNFN